MDLDKRAKAIKLLKEKKIEKISVTLGSVKIF